MCNLNIVIKKSEIAEKKLIPFLMAVSSYSYVNNKDGEGFYFGRVVKSIEKVNIFKYRDELQGQNVILSHQRLSTSGHEEKYTQPFEGDDFIFMHNGIMSQFVKKTNSHSDTFNLFQKFQRIFKELKKDDRKKRIRKAIKKTFNFQSGSFSICIYDKKADKVYYFKNSSTYIHCYKNHNLIYITTESRNEVFLKMLDRDFKQIDFKDNTIYEINPNSLIIKGIGTIKENKRISFDNPNYNTNISYTDNTYNKTNTNKQSYNSLDNEEMAYYEERERELNKSMREDNDDYLRSRMGYFPEVIETTYNRHCLHCSTQTAFYNNILKGFFCSDCILEENWY